MSNDDFAAPSAPGDGIKWNDHKGELLIITAHEYVEGIPTTFGDANAVRADIVAIKDDGTAEEFSEALVFPKVLASQLRKQIGGKKVLGRLGSGQAKPGQSAPHLLLEATDDDITKAKAYLASLDSAPF